MDIDSWSMTEAVETIETYIEKDISDLTEEHKILYVEKLKEKLNNITNLKTQPVNHIRWVDIEKVQAKNEI